MYQRISEGLGLFGGNLRYLYMLCALRYAGLSRFSHGQLCNPVDHSLPGSSVCGILQARVLEWAATPSSRGSS